MDHHKVIEYSIVLDNENRDLFESEQTLQVFRNLHSIFEEKRAQIFRVNPKLPPGRRRSLEPTRTDPIDNGLVNNPANFGYFESRKDLLLRQR